MFYSYTKARLELYVTIMGKPFHCTLESMHIFKLHLTYESLSFNTNKNLQFSNVSSLLYLFRIGHDEFCLIFRSHYYLVKNQIKFVLICIKIIPKLYIVFGGYC